LYVAVSRVHRRLRPPAALNCTMAALAIGGAWILTPRLGIVGVGWAWLGAQTLGALWVGTASIAGRRTPRRRGARRLAKA
jgi:Na+-driven multidrug efflux pump